MTGPAIPIAGSRLGLEYDHLRKLGGVHQVVLPDGSNAWLLTGYSEVAGALANPKLSLDKRHANGWVGFALPPALDANLLNMDPPDHTRIRRLVGQAFTPARVEALRPAVQAIADELVDALVDGRADADLVDAYAAPLAITVISDLLGIPTADRDDFRGWTNAMLTTHPPDRAAAARGITAMHAYVVELVAAVRRRPAGDLISALVTARDHGDDALFPAAEHGGHRLSEDELTSLVFLILFAGYENSINLIANTVLLLLSQPQPVPFGESTVEEALRLLPPAPVAIRRFPIEDIAIAGTTIPAGATVLLSIAAANRDPREFPDPTTVDVDRGRGGHLSLGHGIHYCLGAPLARLEAHIAVATLLRRLPGLELARPAEQLSWRASFRTLGLVELPVRWQLGM